MLAPLNLAAFVLARLGTLMSEQGGQDKISNG